MEGLCVNFSINVCFCCVCVCLFVLRVTDCIYFGCGVQIVYTCDHFHFHDRGMKEVHSYIKPLFVTLFINHKSSLASTAKNK